MLEMFGNVMTPMMVANATLAAELAADKERVNAGAANNVDKAVQGLKLPAAFSNTKNGIRIREWLEQMEDQFVIYDTLDKERITIYANNLNGFARTWFSNSY